MIQDLTKIREELEGFVEVTLPYEFPKGIHLKYITLKKNKEDESFYPGGSYHGIGNNCLFVKNSYKRWSVPIHFLTKDGQIQYRTRFFIPETCENNTHEDHEDHEEIQELRETTQYQQTIIEKMTEEIKESRYLVKSLYEDKQTYEEMLQTNRYRLKELSVAGRDKDEQIEKYKQVIQKLSVSHPMMR